MTRDEQLIKAALDMAAETAGAQMAPITGTPYAAGGRVFATAIRAIDPADVLAKVEVKTPHAWQDVMDERGRQMAVEGWTPEHDDAYQSRDLAAAAACYAMIAGAHRREVFSAPPIGWPWAKSWWKPTDPRRDLVKAGALILAEIERLDRAALAQKGGE